MGIGSPSGIASRGVYKKTLARRGGDRGGAIVPTPAGCSRPALVAGFGISGVAAPPITAAAGGSSSDGADTGLSAPCSRSSVACSSSSSDARAACWRKCIRNSTAARQAIARGRSPQTSSCDSEDGHIAVNPSFVNTASRIRQECLVQHLIERPRTVGWQVEKPCFLFSIVPAVHEGSGQDAGRERSQ